MVPATMGFLRANNTQQAQGQGARNEDRTVKRRGKKGNGQVSGKGGRVEVVRGRKGKRRTERKGDSGEG